MWWEVGYSNFSFGDPQSLAVQEEKNFINCFWRRAIITFGFIKQEHKFPLERDTHNLLSKADYLFSLTVLGACTFKIRILLKTSSLNNSQKVKSQVCRVTTSPRGYKEAVSEEHYANSTIYWLVSSLKSMTLS